MSCGFQRVVLLRATRFFCPTTLLSNRCNLHTYTQCTKLQHHFFNTLPWCACEVCKLALLYSDPCGTWYASRGSAYVKPSAITSSVGLYSNEITSYATFSRRKLSLISMCFGLVWYTGLFISTMHSWLFWYIVVTASSKYARSVSKLRSQITSCVALYKLMYSTSVLDVAIACWRFKFHDTALPFRKM